MKRISAYLNRTTAFLALICLCAALASCSQTEDAVEEPVVETIETKCSLEPIRDPITGENEVIVIFELSTDNPKKTLSMWQGDEKVYECHNVTSNELTGEGRVILLPVKIDGEPFRFEIEGVEDKHEAFMVPIPITYPESPENILYLAVVSHSSDENGWQVGMRSEPVYYE